MQNRQWNNTVGTLKFLENINKLTVGRKTEFWRENDDGSVSLVARVRCDTKNVRPRKFTVTCSDMIPRGTKYKYSTIVKNITDRVGFVK